MHSIGTPDCLHALGREIAKDRLMGISKGTPPVTMRHKQSWPFLMRSLNELQQAEVGDDEPPDPPARKPKQDPKLRSIGPVHMAFVFVFDCAAVYGLREARMIIEVARGINRFMISIWMLVSERERELY